MTSSTVNSISVFVKFGQVVQILKKSPHIYPQGNAVALHDIMLTLRVCMYIPSFKF
jgi:hypothetical protein